MLAGAVDLMRRIFTEFTYDKSASTVDTSVAQVLASRKGVCQDFSHLAIACLRSLGLAARYVSGYLETQPPPGTPKMVGADASHAWVSVFVPEVGWIDFDPTNNMLVGESHITLAWGRDYSDVLRSRAWSWAAVCTPSRWWWMWRRRPRASPPFRKRALSSRSAEDRRLRRPART